MSIKKHELIKTRSDRSYRGVSDGIIVLHNTYSGTFQMLQNFLIEYNEKKYTLNQPIIKITYIDESSPMYQGLCDSFGKPNQATILMLGNGKIINILHSPINKLELINSIKNIYK